MTGDRGEDAVYWIGERVAFTLTVNHAAYVTLVDVGTSGAISTLRVSPGGSGRPLEAGRPHVVPGRGAFEVQGPIGEETVVAIATRGPLPWIQDLYPSHRSGSRWARRLSIVHVASAAKDLRVVPEEEPDQPVDSVDRFCQRVARRVEERGSGPAAFAVMRLRIR